MGVAVGRRVWICTVEGLHFPGTHMATQGCTVLDGVLMRNELARKEK